MCSKRQNGSDNILTLANRHGRVLPNPINRQRGAALLVALVMIFMMTVLGLTAMRESSLEKRMTTNSVHKSSTFQSAESATDLIINDPDNLAAAYEVGKQPINITLPSPSNTEMALTGSIEYTGIGPPIGFSWDKTGGGGFQALRYRIEGESKIINVQSSSKVRQGSYRTVPSLN